jgi:uncharacterized protein
VAEACQVTLTRARLHPLTALKKPLTIWIIGDGKPGHENQSLGLSDALSRRMASEIHSIPISGKYNFISKIRAALEASKNLPKPDLIIGAGHATHPSLLWLTRKHQSKSIVLMKPSLPFAWFDFCIIPEHDFKNSTHSGNVILTKGAINRVIALNAEKSQNLILIGGQSSTHGWDGTAILTALQEITREGDWILTDSRRTPEDFKKDLMSHFPKLKIFSHAKTPPTWLPTQLAKASQVWVTEDSISMVYEALSSGARVGLLPLPRLKANARVLRGIESLITEGCLTRFAEWQISGDLQASPHSFQEADRCAERVIQHFKLDEGSE